MGLSRIHPAGAAPGGDGPPRPPPPSSRRAPPPGSGRSPLPCAGCPGRGGKGPHPPGGAGDRPVCALGEQSSPALPLQGRRVIVTRPKNGRGALSGKLRALGAQVLEFPCIETRPLSPCPPLERALSRLSSYSWAVFTSAAGVEAVWETLAALGRTPGPSPRCAWRPSARAPAKPWPPTACGRTWCPLCTTAPTWPRPCWNNPRKSPCSCCARTWPTQLLPQALSQGGGRPLGGGGLLPHRVHLSPGVEQARDWVREGAVAAFTSASTVRSFAAALGEELDYRNLTACCIGPQTERQAGTWACSPAPPGPPP